MNSILFTDKFLISFDIFYKFYRFLVDLKKKHVPDIFEV